MPEPIANPPSALPIEPELNRTGQEPKGVLQKTLKPLLYLGAAVLVIVAAVFSSTGAKTPAKKSETANQPPQPLIQDNTDNNVQDMKNQATAQQKAAQQGVDPTLANATPAQQAAAQAYGPTGLPIPCVPGQPCTQQQTATMQPQPTPAQQEEQQLAASHGWVLLGGDDRPFHFSQEHKNYFTAFFGSTVSTSGCGRAIT